MADRWKKTLLIGAALCLLLTGCGGGGSGEDELTVLTIGTADSGGTMYTVGSACLLYTSEGYCSYPGRSYGRRSRGKKSEPAE